MENMASNSADAPKHTETGANPMDRLFREAPTPQFAHPTSHSEAAPRPTSSDSLPAPIRAPPSMSRGESADPAPSPPLRSARLAQEPPLYELPSAFQRVIRYYIASSPPGQLALVTESCRALLELATSTIEEAHFQTSLQHAIDTLCTNQVERYAERQFVVVPMQQPGQAAVLVAQRLRRGKGGARWYLAPELSLLFRVDPLRSIVTESRAASWDMVEAGLLTEADMTDFDDPYRSELQRILRERYINRHFNGQKTALAVFFHGAGAHTPSASSSASSTPDVSPHGSPRRPRRAAPPHHRFSTDDRRLLWVIIGAESVNAANFWGGSWKSVWEIDMDGRVPKSPVAIKGRIMVSLHYTEDGSVLLQHVSQHDNTSSTPYTGATQFAVAVTDTIAALERKAHRHIQRYQLKLQTTTIRSLRRALPLGGRSFDWAGETSRLSEDVMAYHTLRQST